MQSNQPNVNDNQTMGNTPTASQSGQPVATPLSDTPTTPPILDEQTTEDVVQKLNTADFEARKAADEKFRQKLEERDARYGNPNAQIVDPGTSGVQPRYDIVQNQSNFILIIPDLKASEDDLGELLKPGQWIKLTDFYSPLQINRSKGLRSAATEIKGIGDNMALVPLKSEEEAKAFVPPQRAKYAPGTSFEDQSHNDFDDRFAELEMRDEKRENKLRRKTLGSRRTAKHGQVNNV